jgi:hypothetical protein
MNVLSKEMNVFRIYIHFGLCTTSPDVLSSSFEAAGTYRDNATPQHTSYAAARHDMTAHGLCGPEPKNHQVP